MKKIPIFYHIPKCAGTYVKERVFNSFIKQEINQGTEKINAVWNAIKLSLTDIDAKRDDINLILNDLNMARREGNHELRILKRGEYDIAAAELQSKIETQHVATENLQSMRASHRKRRACKFHLSINGKSPYPVQVNVRNNADFLSDNYFDTLDNFKNYLKQGLVEICCISYGTGHPLDFVKSSMLPFVDELVEISLRESFYFTIMREPFSWHQSMFYYLRDVGTWESIYGVFDGMTFSDYINSNQLADSWIIRNLTGLDDSLPITDKEYNQTIEMLSSKFTVGFVDDIDGLVLNLSKKFGWVYDDKILPYGGVGSNPDNVNKISIKKPISEISKHDLEVFTTRTKYDAMLYEHFKGKQS